jgi:hypothetical protein
MKKKKSIIYACVGAVVIIGFAISYFVEWPIDYNNASGDIAKSSRFSRQLADAGVSNMQELLQNDEEFKNGLVTAYLVMKTRADQFNALVDMSVEVASGISEFESVLKDMKETQPMINNVCASVEAAGNDLNSALGGETANDLEQNTSNAALAYSTLQKQNNLADQFIEVADNYLKKEDGNDRLKFVRDQWLDYQQVTAALDQNEQLAQELGNKGYQLSEDKRVAALGSFSGPLRNATIYGNTLGNAFGFKKLSLSNTLNTLDAALSAQQKIRVMSATEQGSLDAVEKNALSAVEKNALNAVQQGALSAVYKELAKAVEQGALSAVQQNGLSAVQQNGSLSAVQQNGSLSAVQQGSLQMLNLVLYGNMSNIQGALNGMIIRNAETGGVNMLGTARQFNEFEDLIDSRARPAINE